MDDEDVLLRNACRNFIYCKHERIELYPDYASSGMWCADCELGFGNPIKEFPLIPKGLLSLIVGWNDLWELATENQTQIFIKTFDNLLIKMGLELAAQVSKYYPCKCSIKRTKIGPNWKKNNETF